MNKNTFFNFLMCLALVIPLLGTKSNPDSPVTAEDIGIIRANSSYEVNPFFYQPWIYENDLPGSTLGAAVASAGDVNGDGYDDTLIGAPHYEKDQTLEGKVYLFYGSPTGIVGQIPAWTFENNLAGCELGWSVASAGDVNGDGYDDVLAGSPYCGELNREGRVYLFLGSATGLPSMYDWMFTGPSGSEESVGWSSASAGDVNNDGYDDVIIGAPWASYPDGHEGRAYVFYGSAAGLASSADWTEESNVAWVDFGSSVSSAGDVNGDGFDDVIIGAANFSNPEESEGRAYVYYGSAGGLSHDPAWMYEVNLEDTQLGEEVASAGDVNGDGFSDVIVGAFEYDHDLTNEGIVFAFYGSPTGLSLTPDWSAEGDQTGAEFGHAAASGGDVNGDGFSDVIVGAPWYSHGEDYEGVAKLYYGSAAGLALAPAGMLESDQERANLGYSAKCAGDINGDGLDDLIIGAQYYDGGQGEEGRAYVFLGRANFDYTLFAPIIQRPH